MSIAALLSDWHMADMAGNVFGRIAVENPLQTTRMIRAKICTTDNMSILGKPIEDPNYKGRLEEMAPAVTSSDLAECIDIQHLERFFNSIPDLACFASTEGYFTKLNIAWEKTLGYTLQELLGRPYLELVHPDDIDATLEEMQKQSNGDKAKNFINRYRCRDGSYRWLEWNATPDNDRMLIFATARDITERKAEERELHEGRERLRQLTRRLTDLQETERRRLSQDIHDSLAGNLTALGINLDIILSDLPPCPWKGIARRIKDSQTLVEETVLHIRGIMAELRPPILDEYGLLAALEWYAKRFFQLTSIPVEVSGTKPEPRTALETEVSLFRIVQEALTNAAKHAKASKIDILMKIDGSCLMIAVSDDGIGFQPSDRKPGAAGWGLITMTERAEAIGGRLSVISACGAGTEILVEVRL